MLAPPLEVIVNDRMQQGYRYLLTKPEGRDFADDFRPELTPPEMLALGVFGGKYMTDCRDEFPTTWFTEAKLSPEAKDPSLNFFGVDASLPLTEWQRRGWIHPDDPPAQVVTAVPVVLPLLPGPADARRRPAPDRAVDSDATPRGSDQQELRHWRLQLPPTSAAGPSALGLRLEAPVGATLPTAPSLARAATISGAPRSIRPWN
jgi:hypothetical protein